MESEGWIKLHRQFLSWEWHDSPGTAYLFVVLLLLANHHEGEKWHGKKISKGQLITSRDNLSVITGLTVRQVRTGLSRLEETGEIIKESTSQYTLITICNYSKYQVKDEPARPTNDQRATSERPASDQQTTTNKNDKNEKNIYITHSIEEPVEIFSQSWRFLSSMQRTACGNNKDRMAEMKKEIFSKQVKEIAQTIAMPPDQIDDFIRYYTEHTPGDDRIRAENYDPFNVRDRMISWMKRERPRGGAARQAMQPQQPSKLQQTIAERNKFQQVLHGFINNKSADGAPDSQ